MILSEIMTLSSTMLGILVGGNTPAAGSHVDSRTGETALEATQRVVEQRGGENWGSDSIINDLFCQI